MSSRMGVAALVRVRRPDEVCGRPRARSLKGSNDCSPSRAVTRAVQPVIAGPTGISPQVQLLKVFLAILVWQRNSIMSRRLGTPQFDTTDLARNGLRQLGEGNPANSLVRCQTRANVTKDRQRRVAIRLVPRGNGDKRPSALQAASDQGWVRRRPRQLPRARSVRSPVRTG
jgi:hypothetical protein